MALKSKLLGRAPTGSLHVCITFKGYYVSVFLLIDLTAKVIYHLRCVLLLICACGKIVCIGHEFLLSLLRSSLLGGKLKTIKTDHEASFDQLKMPGNSITPNNLGSN